MCWKSGYQTAGDAFHFLFLASWIVTRCIIYPALMVVFVRYWWVVMVPPFERWVNFIPPRELPWIQYLPIAYFPVHVYFVVMNLKWTRDLFTPIVKNLYARVRSWWSGDNEKKEQ